MDAVMTFQLVLFQYNTSTLLIHVVKACFLTQTCRTAQTSRVASWEHTIVPSLANRKFLTKVQQLGDNMRTDWEVSTVAEVLSSLRPQLCVAGHGAQFTVQEWMGASVREKAAELQHWTKRCWEKKNRLTILKQISWLNSLFSFYFSKPTLKVCIQNEQHLLPPGSGSGSIGISCAWETPSEGRVPFLGDTSSVGAAWAGEAVDESPLASAFCSALGGSLASTSAGPSTEASDCSGFSSSTSFFSVVLRSLGFVIVFMFMAVP